MLQEIIEGQSVKMTIIYYGDDSTAILCFNNSLVTEFLGLLLKWMYHIYGMNNHDHLFINL